MLFYKNNKSYGKKKKKSEFQGKLLGLISCCIKMENEQVKKQVWPGRTFNTFHLRV